MHKQIIGYYISNAIVEIMNISIKIHKNHLLCIKAMISLRRQRMKNMYINVLFSLKLSENINADIIQIFLKSL